MKVYLKMVCTLIFLFMGFFAFNSAIAHPGNTASDGCHYCRTNCDSWGVAWNQRHCHGGGYDSYDDGEAAVDAWDESDEYDASDFDPDVDYVPRKSITPAADIKNTSATDSSGSGCYIATAAYGTPTAKDIDVLREFRDIKLLNNKTGASFVNAYYKFSPPIANVIADNELLKFIVREYQLKPIVNVLQATRAVDIWGNN